MRPRSALDLSDDIQDSAVVCALRVALGCAPYKLQTSRERGAPSFLCARWRMEKLQMSVHVEDDRVVTSVRVPPIGEMPIVDFASKVIGRSLGDAHWYELPLQLLDQTREKHRAPLPISPLDLGRIFRVSLLDENLQTSGAHARNGSALGATPTQ